MTTILETQKQISGGFVEEQKIATANQNLIDLYTQKIQIQLSEIWGE